MARGLVIGEGVKIRALNLSRKVVDCPTCQTPAKRHSLGHRWIRDIGTTSPAIIEITFSKHYCPKCDQHFNLPTEHLAPARSNFTNRVHKTAIDLVRHGNTHTEASKFMEKKYNVHVPASTIAEWVNE